MLCYKQDPFRDRTGVIIKYLRCLIILKLTEEMPLPVSLVWPKEDNCVVVQGVSYDLIPSILLGKKYYSFEDKVQEMRGKK